MRGSHSVIFEGAEYIVSDVARVELKRLLKSFSQTRKPVKASVTPIHREIVPQPEEAKPAKKFKAKV